VFTNIFFKFGIDIFDDRSQNRPYIQQGSMTIAATTSEAKLGPVSDKINPGHIQNDLIRNIAHALN
jgi:hypothetical protein